MNQFLCIAADTPYQADMDDITLIRRRAVMTRALLRSAERLGLTREQLALATGLGLAEITALSRDELRLDPTDPRWDACVRVVQTYRALDVRAAGDPGEVKAWMLGFCEALGGVPAEIVGRNGRLAEVLAYLESTTAGLDSAKWTPEVPRALD